MKRFKVFLKFFVFLFVITFANSAFAAKITCAAGTYWNGSACTTCPATYYCTGFTRNNPAVNYGRTLCPTGYRVGGTGLTAQNQCKLQTTAGSYIATANSSTQSSCSYGYYCPAALVNYGSTGSRISCPSGYMDGDMGASSQNQCQMWTYDGEYVANPYDTTATTCPAGSYCVSEYINYGSTGSIQTCTGATYSGAGASSCTTCPGSYTANTTAGKTAQNQCQIQTTAGRYIATANSSTLTLCTSQYYCPAALINYGSTGTRTLCPVGYRSGGTGLTLQSDCKLQTTAGQYIATANSTTQTACTAGYYCPATLVGYGSTGNRIQCTGATYSGASASSCTNCPGSYTANIDAGKTANTQCQIQTTAGQYIATANTSTQTACTVGYYCPVSLINYGSTGTRTQCLAGTYSTGSAAICTECITGSYSAVGASSCIACQGGTTTASSGMVACDTDCSNNNEYDTSWLAATWNTGNTISNLCSVSGCSGGYYLASDSCVGVGASYWSAAGSITRTACDAGLTTIGYGAGADESGDCGREFNVGSNNIHLRSVKKTSPSLYIQLGGSTYYGNMTTEIKGKLRANYGGINYSLSDDSM